MLFGMLMKMLPDPSENMHASMMMVAQFLAFHVESNDMV
jgi:hypothetical protein